MEREADEWEQHIAPTEEGNDEPSGVNRFEVMSYPADTTLSGYREQWDGEQIFIPKFQRNFVWDQVRASRLIESFLLGLPVPGVFLYKERNATNYWVIDGQQRIRSIVSYFKGTFRNRKFVLKGVAGTWEGRAFEDLSKEDQFRLSSAVMRATIIQQLHPDDKDSIYLVFERLNTGGVNLNPMEVRMCIAEGEFIGLLRNLNKHETWRKLIGWNTEDKRARDMELILRVMALHDWHEKYEKPMKRFLNSYIQEHRNPTSKWLEQKEQEFIFAVERAALLGEKPFHPEGRLNYAVLDSILVPLMSSGQEDKAALRSSYESLIHDEDYRAMTSRNTSDKRDITDRIRMAKERFQ